MLKLAGETNIGILEAHEADLDAHTRNLWEVRRTTAIYYPPQIGTRPGGATGTVLDAANRLFAMPFPIAVDRTADRIVCNVTVQAGQKIRMGIYSNGVNMAPGTLLLDAGEVTLSGIGEIAITIDQALPKGLYWVALVSDGTPAIREVNTNCLPLPGSGTNGVYVAHTYGALPDPFGAANFHYRAWFFGLRFS